MTREQTISKMMDMANALIGNWTRAGEDEIWTMCSDWNSEHPDEEIFMCESDMDEYGNTTEYVNGFYIEDDHWIFEERGW